MYNVSMYAHNNLFNYITNLGICFLLVFTFPTIF